ncbi:DUF2871 domain-containing protein [Staphylococcus nepalensis]|uniref:DUF2871 domain-containing protein n=1 Tax=Staphylococcus nepalensis TaxID=214473 RepID=A0ABS3L422_9STAP|nr:DUF2871 domain-containing protein [Staphylococcus nepalensis]MBO1212356.1 DUF2871 domain-containing protein [Staphylococcus nepalensis]MBO1217007.1 DUF2871 domain-containing protein [Staphylococcus nepalensis]MBO1228304.1 DUF2871 domain-containing protein [Staphylococcus nepalensis]MBO1235269.1 DUF2871 domain-containing protein [Staphylococcus nepalensis]MBO1238369.1 DUF2871 domain-containing protein [Staphylococcus nepalensis]
MKKLMYSSILYTILGMLSGLFYREMSKAENFSGYSQLNVTHTHLLVLGTIMFLIFLVIENQLKLTKHHTLFNYFFYVYHVGILVTVAMQFVNGIAVMKGFSVSPAIAGISGLGHITISIAFILFFVLLNKSINANAHQNKS